MATTFLTRLKPEAKGIYSADTAYEANCLVTSTDGVRVYLSVKDAPAGTPLTDTSYFVIHTDLSATVQSAEDAAQKAAAAREEMLEIARGLTDAVEASGKAVQLELAGAIPFDRVETVLKPVQAGSGDPSPDNIRAISGWTGAELTRCGKNLLNPARWGFPKTSKGVTVTANADGSLTVSGTTTATSGYLFTYMYGNILDELADGEIYTSSGINLAVGYLDGHNEYFSSSFTVDKSTMNSIDPYFQVHVDNYSDGMTVYPQLVLGNESLDFTAYQGDSFTAEFDDTIYGGTLNWTTGELTLSWKLLTLAGTEYWQNHNNTFMYMGVSVQDSADSDQSIASSHYYYGIGFYLTGTYNNQLRIYESGYTDVDAWKAFLAEQYAAGTPVQVVYRLATPTTVQLTPQEIKQLNGTNTLYGDGTIQLQGRERPDYWTNADKAEMVEDVLEALPTWTGGSY